MSKSTIYFFTTSGCHLCEQAYQMLDYFIKNDAEVAVKIDIKVTEIADNDQLVEQYGIRIPVLKNSTSELGWPFELEELRLWLIQ